MSKIQDLLTQIKATAENSWVEVKANLETKANEVIHSTNTWYGKELMEVASQSSDVIDMTIANSNILQAFRWNHWKTIPLTGAKLPIIGDTAFYSTDTEWTTWALLSQVAQGTYRTPTAEVTIMPKKYKMTCDISDEQLKNPLVNIEQIVMDKLSKWAIKTVEGVLINWDTTTGATWNVNKDDGAPTAWIYYLNADWLRKQALITKWVAWVDKIDLWTLAWADFVAMQNATWYLWTSPADWVWLMELKTQGTAMQLTEYTRAYENGKLSSIISGRWALNEILGSQVIVPRDLRLTEADWKQSATASNNTKGQVLYVHRDAVQYWFYWDYNFETVRIPWTWIQVIGWFYFGFAIVNQLAWETDPCVVIGYNATIV